MKFFFYYFTIKNNTALEETTGCEHVYLTAHELITIQGKNYLKKNKDLLES